MATRKLSISVPAEIEEIIKAHAAQEGKPVSSWLAEAAAEKAATSDRLTDARAAARELIAEYEADNGPLPTVARRQARQFLIDTGLLDPDHRAVG